MPQREAMGLLYLGAAFYRPACSFGARVVCFMAPGGGHFDGGAANSLIPNKVTFPQLT